MFPLSKNSFSRVLVGLFYWGEVDKRKFRDALCSRSYCSWSQDYANKQTKQSKIQKALPHPNHPFPLVILDSLVSSANTSTGQLVYTVKSPSPLLGVVFSECFLHLSIYCQNWVRVLTGIPMDCCIPNVFFYCSILQLILMIRITYPTRMVTPFLASWSFGTRNLQDWAEYAA